MTPPAWLQQFADRVSEQIRAVDVLAPLGCHFFESPDQWEITLFVSATEILGGPQDGRRRVSRFFVDVQGVCNTFDHVESVTWQAQGLGAEDDLGPHLSVEGIFRGQAIWLRIPALTPRAFEPGRVADVHQRTWEEIW